jgi:adenosylcobinamide-GDP ribazoletransferase
MFPRVGIAVGLAGWGWLWLCRWLGFGVLLRAAGLTLVPGAVTGGIHLDGFCDTVDALASRAPAERKREILKDPHAGAFAVIGAAAYLLLYFGIASELPDKPQTPLLLLLTYVMCRVLSALSVLLFPRNEGKGLLASFRESADRTVSVVVLSVFFAAAAAGLAAAGGAAGLVMLGGALVCVGYLYFMSRRSFGGMSGDLAGFFLQIAELTMLAANILVDKAVSL